MSEEKMSVGEQPISAEVQAVATGFDNGTDKQMGSPIGKFKNADTLLDAYNELQSEFTRKCQKLSEVEKKMNELNLNSSELNNLKSSNEFTWNDKIHKFLESYENASVFVEDIINELVNDKSLKEIDNGLEKAYMKVLEKKYISEEQLVNDQKFLEKYIYSNDQIKNKIINEYVSTLQQNKSPIKITNDGYSRGVASSNNFGSLEEARKYVENMFKF